MSPRYHPGQILYIDPKHDGFWPVIKILGSGPDRDTYWYKCIDPDHEDNNAETIDAFEYIDDKYFPKMNSVTLWNKLNAI